MPRARRLGALMLGTVLLTGCAAPAARGADLPPTSGVFDYQLGGLADALADGTAIDVVVRDATADPLPGAYNVCYVNGFQTQPGVSWDEELLLRGDDGAPVTDPDWPDEYVLDPSTAPQREAILDAILPTIDACTDAGFDALEIDNLDTWTRFPAIERAAALELATAYVEAADRRGLAIAQKNAAEAAVLAHGLGVDFAVVEECAAYDECDAYARVYGSHVLQIEYPDSLADAGIDFAEACADAHRAPLTILRDRDLVAPEDAGYRYESCTTGPTG